VVRHAEVKYNDTKNCEDRSGKEQQKKKQKETGQECLVNTVPHGRKRERALPLVLPGPRRPNLKE
jgi:hypothetical protein